ncbi:TetR/AcrR family transcriptional regulator [Rhizohabitans arisaemae]|uniref:TetR/AcrR family transcriptional regulator n=1 Tax=Rhizohabitans arisaemae TaxID=2720610 RepID=UPI0024B26E04|nr:TetR/AcrR family transcriptional regulator [Rhizohabitans arisaemae]
MGRASRMPPARQDEDTSPRRADAERNISTIMATALELFSTNAGVSMADVARSAGLGRVTVYAHFPSRAALLQALVRHSMAQAEQSMDAELTDGDAPADRMLARVIGATWRVLDRYRKLRVHALSELGSEWLSEQHDPVFQRVEKLIARGREQGVFRRDQPIGWMVTVVFSLIHTAGDEVEAGRLSSGEAPGLLRSTLGSALSPPA